MDYGIHNNLILMETSWYNLQHWLIFVTAFLFLALIVVYYILSNKRRISKLIDIHAYADDVTGYSNYSKFITDAEIMLKFKDRRFAVCYVDVSNFKAVNDFYGREQGDRVLKLVADRIHDLVMPDGIFARRFADRFVFMISYLDIKSLSYIIETYLSEIEFQIPGVAELIKIKCNCGIYEVDNKKEVIDEMVDKSAIAAKLSKNSIQKTVTLLDKDINKSILTNQEITYKMDKAFANEEFIVYIQPKLSFKTEKIVGGEALIRWRDKKGNIIPPGEFIPLFEKNGFVTKVDFYVLEKVCNMLSNRFNDGRNIVPISVNQSRLHVYDNLYINKLINVFDKYNLDKSNIIFEITESAFTENTQDMIELMNRMTHLGYQISMDDFGCGYSSLNMLNCLPISELKLDKTFIDDSSDRSRYIIKSIVNLAHGLNIYTVCEGVETAEQVEFLKGINCDVAQGFFYARPMPMEDFEKMLDEQYR